MLKNDDPVYQRKKSREYRLRVKKMVFYHYGEGDPHCVICDERDLAKLTIEHINDNGHNERKITGSGSNFYTWLKKNNFPDNGYEIRCFSCNLGKRINPELRPVYGKRSIYGSLMNRLVINFNVFLTTQR